MSEEKASTRIRRLADEACEQKGYREAEAMLARSIYRDKELTAYAIASCARAEVLMAMTVRRKAIFGAVETEVRPGGIAPRKYSEGECSRVSEWGGKYLSWPLSNRKVLGEATLSDVKAEAEMYEHQAQGNARNGRFMRLVEKRLLSLKATPADIVGKVLDDRALGGLMARASKA